MSEAARCFGVERDEIRQLRNEAKPFDPYNGGRSRMVLDLLRKNVELSTDRLAMKMGCRVKSTQRQMQRMRRRGLVVGRQPERGFTLWSLP